MNDTQYSPPSDYSHLQHSSLSQACSSLSLCIHCDNVPPRTKWFRFTFHVAVSKWLHVLAADFSVCEGTLFWHMRIIAYTILVKGLMRGINFVCVCAYFRQQFSISLWNLLVYSSYNFLCFVNCIANVVICNWKHSLSGNAQIKAFIIFWRIIDLMLGLQMFTF